MTPLQIISLTGFAAVIAGGQILLKRVALSVRELAFLDAIGALAWAPMFWVALALYGVATLLWIWILTQVPLSRAYPFIALAMVLVSIAGWSLFGEAISSGYWIGAGLVIGGLALIVVV